MNIIEGMKKRVDKLAPVDGGNIVLLFGCDTDQDNGGAGTREHCNHIA